MPTIRKKTPDLRPTAQLRLFYERYMLPMEQEVSYPYFHSPKLSPGDFENNAMVIIVGQYSTGKTTFIQHIIKDSYPGMNIGPEPTTDRFNIIMYGKSEIIPGPSLVMDATKPFGSMKKFGRQFLNQFQACQLENETLKNITIVDTPGILSGEKQRINRGYDFPEVVRELASKCAMVLILFDANKLDISDEFKRVIELLVKKERDKIRVALNKSDALSFSQLMRVTGALMWSLGKIFDTPEVVRLYIGSFKDGKLDNDECQHLFESESEMLYSDMSRLPADDFKRKSNDLIQRCSDITSLGLVLHYLRKEMPTFMGKDKKKKELLDDLENIFSVLAKRFDMHVKDFPDIKMMREKLQDYDLSSNTNLKMSSIERFKKETSEQLPKLIALMPEERVETVISGKGTVSGGVFVGKHENTPFTVSALSDINLGIDEDDWIVNKHRAPWDEDFIHLDPVNGLVAGTKFREYAKQFALPHATLREVWRLCDTKNRGKLDQNEFVLACYLIKLAVKGTPMPVTLPEHLKLPKYDEYENDSET